MDDNLSNTDSIIIKPRRSYHCKNCQRMCARADVQKDMKTGKHYCKVCGWEVEDKTDSQTGHDFLEIVGM